MARPAPSDEGSPARLIATMVGIVGILLLGSLAWSAVGAMFAALGEAAAAISPHAAPPTPFATAIAATPQVAFVAPTMTSTALATPSQTPAPITATATPVPKPTATPAASGRSPWILLPQPSPGGRVDPGPVVIEARGRGDAPITAMRLDLDGAALPVSLEHRNEATWRAFASTNVRAGEHNVRATVVDDQGRTGSFRWSFTAGP